MKNFLRVAALAICAIFMTANASAQAGMQRATLDATGAKRHVLLETANWGQNYPFNEQIFTAFEGTTHAKAGCVPTAYAIVMRYHGFPEEGTAKILYNCQASTYVEITDRTYDWSKMPLTYSNDWTQEQIDEVSKLFSHVLHAVFPSSIGTNATTANEEQTSAKLNRYFNYKLINASYQANFTMDDWADKLRESIDNGCPVPYAANNSGTGDTRHMFVVDGYTDNGYFHFNFGWNGSSNGWFKLDDITPSQGDNYSWNGNSQHYALFNLMPNKTPRTVTATTNSSSMGTVSINGGTAGNSVSAEVTEGTKATLTAHPADGYALANWTKNGVIVGTKNPIQVTVSESDNDYVANFDDVANVQIEKTCTFKISDVTTSGVNGSYCSTWTTSDGIVLNCTKGSEPAYALSTSVNTFFAKAPVGNSETLVSDITYTLTAPEGFVIKSYSFKGKSPSSSYTIDVTVGGNTTNVTNASAGVVISASDINSQSTSFVLGSTYTGRAGLSIMEDGITVTIVSEGGASTPTPDPEPEPTPTTYAVTTTANPAAGGTAKFAVGTGSQKTQGDVNSGEQITLYATPNTGYTFVNWTLNGAAVSTDATCNVSVSQVANYVANFEANVPGEETNPLAGKWFRLKENNNNRYMNVKNHTAHTQKVSAGGVNVAAKDENSNAQKFFFEKSGDGYMLKDGDGYYINCLEWSVDASSTTSGSVLLFEETSTENIYYIKWNNTYKGDVKYFKVGADSNGTGDYPYCDADNKTVTWTLEEVTPSNKKTMNVTFGELWSASEVSRIVTKDSPAITITEVNSANKIGYSTKNDGKHPFLLKGGQFTISVPAPYKIASYTLVAEYYAFNNSTVEYTIGIGSTATATINSGTSTLSATGLNNSEICINLGDATGTPAGLIITSLAITYIEEEFEPAMFKAEIENWRNNNPNTHLGTITIGGTPMKLTPEHLTASELTMPVVEGTTLAFTRKYRGFEFQGFYIGETSLGENPTLTADNVAAIDENNPLVAKFTATDDVTLFYDDATYSYRIPAIAKTGTNRLVAISDYRHNLDDIGRDRFGTGKLRIDLVMRTSDDNGATWSDIKTIAAGDDSKVGSYLRAFGDAAVAAYGNNIIVMAAAGDVMYSSASATNTNKMVRVFSSDNGANWTIDDMTTKMYSTSTSLFPNHFSAFFGSGKLAVDNNFNGTNNARIYGALLMKNSSSSYNNFVVYSDDLGANWHILGGSQDAIAGGDEPKVEILPSGQILLSARRQGGRIFRVFTYGTDKANGEGSWGDAAVNGCGNGGSNGTNGEIICLDAKKPNGKATKILLQSQPKGGSGHYERYNVTIWYKEITDEAQTPSSIANGWTQGLEVCPAGIKSAYSAMALQENGEIAFFFEEAPCYADNHEKGYSMVYVPLTIEEITGENFLNPNAVVKTVTVDVTLTDNEGNTYTHQFDYLPGDAAAIDAALKAAYPFITLGAEGNLQGSDTYYTYTNTVTLPFKVSNANTTVWHNIYFPANGTSAGEYYPIYLMAENENATAVAKITEKVHYGNSQYNTYNYADKLAWAVYNVNEGFTFKFKNKLTGKFMAVTGVSSDNTNNVVYTDEAGATAFTLEKYTGGNASYGNYAIKSVYNSTTGYVCNTSVGYTYATNYPGTGHAGAWVKFVESPDYWTIYNQLIADIDNFCAGEGKYTANDAISSIDKDALATMPINSLNTQKENVQTVKDSYTEITLTVPAVDDVVPGSVKILGEEVSHKFVPKGEITIQAMPAAGYRFVNWTRPAAAASAAARTAEARNSDVVSDQNPYTVTVSEALSLEANFEEILVNVTLTDGQGNKYIEQLDGFTNGVTKETIAAKLVEKHPYITLGTEATGITLEGSDGAYTYTNTVELPFKVSNTTYIWHNIYWPSNTKAYDYPVYWAASDANDTYVPKVTGSYAYGDHPTYNTKDGNNKISWAIYNVNNSFEFIFKNKVTQKYIQVTGVASTHAQNVVYVENAEDATAFTIEKKPAGNEYDTPAQYALAATVSETTGYLCSTSATGYNYATHYSSNTHQGAWVEFVESPDYYSKIMDLGIVLGYFFGDGDGKCIIPGTDIEPIDATLKTSSGSITLNTLNAYAQTMEVAMATWPTIRLLIAPDESGTVTINNEEGVKSKRAPEGHKFPIAATPAVGYHFVNWTTGTDELSTNAEHTVTISGVKGEITNITANFAINIYTVSVTAGEGGSASASAATVEHGNEVTLIATANDGYEFAGWYNGEELVSNEANYTFTATSDINYTARFREEEAGTPTTFAIRIEAVDTNGNPLTNNATGKVQAIINNVGIEWCTAYDFVENASVELVATNDHNESAYLFEGWYKNGELVSKELEITVPVTEATTYQARFLLGSVVTLASSSKTWGYPNIITYENGDPVAGTATKLRAVARDGERLLISINPNYGYRVANWTDKDGNEVAGKNANSFILTVNGDNNYTANLEKASYTLTVRANNEGGTVSAESVAGGIGTEIIVGHNMTATITATANDGYYFVNWTKGTEVVSESATYTIAGIENVEDMLDVEYVANFLPVENAVAGVYYRIGYDGFAAAASAGAARAAGDVVTLTISYANGSFKTGEENGPTSIWTSSSNSPTLTLTATYEGTEHKNINKVSTTTSPLELSLNSRPYGKGSYYNETKYTIAIDDTNYKITDYSISYKSYQNGAITGAVSNQLVCTGLSNNSVSFYVTGTGQNSAVDIQSFTVTIQQVSDSEGEGGEAGGGGTPETPEVPETPTEPTTNRYYMQSVASKVSGKTNALLMTQETGASSIFYYADSKLLSYDKGTYLNEIKDMNGTLGARGLQDVGVEGGDVEFAGNKIKVINGTTSTVYLHANQSGTTYFVDRCGNDNCGTPHNFVLEEVTTLPVTISSALHATFYAPVAVAIPDGVKAYVLKAEDIPGVETYAWMTSLKNGIIPANTGVIIKGAEGTYDFDIVDNSVENYDAARAEAVGNVLDGTVAKTKITEDAYILANREGRVGLYPVAKNSYLDTNTITTTVRFTNNSHKAYLPVTDDWFGEQLKKGTGFRFVYDDEETTGIDEFETELEDTIYDLQGRKLSEITEPGIYIVGGKKVWVK